MSKVALFAFTIIKIACKGKKTSRISGFSVKFESVFILKRIFDL